MIENLVFMLKACCALSLRSDPYILDILVFYYIHNSAINPGTTLEAMIEVRSHEEC